MVNQGRNKAWAEQNRAKTCPQVPTKIFVIFEYLQVTNPVWIQIGIPFFAAEQRAVQTSPSVAPYHYARIGWRENLTEVPIKNYSLDKFIELFWVTNILPGNLTYLWKMDEHGTFGSTSYPVSAWWVYLEILHMAYTWLVVWNIFYFCSRYME